MTEQTLESAVRDAVWNSRRWMGGAAIVQYDDGNYEAVPGAHLGDISWSGRERLSRVVYQFADITDLTGPVWSLDVDAITDEDVAFLAQMIEDAAV